MKYLIIIVMGITMLSPVYCQNTSSSFDLHISANVVETIEVITISDIDAGIILPGQEQKIISPITDGGAGSVMLQGQANSSVQISYSKQVTMTNLQAVEPLLMSYMLSGSNENNQSASLMLQNNPANVVLNSEGIYYVWVGCKFSLEGLVSGQYDGDFIIEVDYN